MKTYKLNKVQKGRKFEYTVTDEVGTIISQRMSARDYVACTANGEFYFGRLDLVGKGDHGKAIACSAKAKDDQKGSATHRSYFAQRFDEINKIAYL